MGARTDLVDDPRVARELLWARRGQSYFSRKLNELRDEELARASLAPGWSRAHVAAHVGYQARALARVIEGAAAGIPTPMYDSVGQHEAEVSFGATLPVDALRNLVAHAAVHLNVEWRDLPAAAWATTFPAQEEQVPVAETVRLRGLELWSCAVLLGNGADPEDFPAEVRERLAVGSPLFRAPGPRR